jgi:endogenous inhibitor of DNA gyrase (YacG/DUF329 family)
MDADIERIVNAYADPTCLRPSCSEALGTSPSRYFCSESCQNEWAASLVDPRVLPYDTVMEAARRSERLRGPWWAAGRPAA